MLDEQIEAIADNYLLTASFLPGIGIVNGKTGLALFFFQYYRHTGLAVYQEYAYQLIDEIYADINSHTPVNLGYGLCGFGWALAYLHYQGFIEGCLNEILEEIDELAWNAAKEKTKDFSLLTGMEGIFFYLLCREYDSGKTKSFREPIARIFSDRFPVTQLNELITEAYTFDFEASFYLLLNHWKQDTLFSLSWQTIFDIIKEKK